jgi:hypothetical protein
LAEPAIRSLSMSSLLRLLMTRAKFFGSATAQLMIGIAHPLGEE